MNRAPSAGSGRSVRLSHGLWRFASSGLVLASAVFLLLSVAIPAQAIVPPFVPSACCLPDGSCLVLDLAECDAFNGSWNLFAQCDDPGICACDEAISGQCPGFTYSEEGSCDPNGPDCNGASAILFDSNCDGIYDQCLLCPVGTQPTDSNGDGCEDLCDCCPKVDCPPGETAFDTDGDGCDDTCLCEQAESGQCGGFDYSNDPSCDPFGPDCGGANAINADLDCNGAYEVCLLCAPGTIPVDTNGDGCEDLCNCCDELVCDEGEVPIDTDGDLCPDLCECAAAKSGQCDGFDYSNDPFCDPNGLDCGLAGILGDLNCDGIYEVCLECEPGTVPVDTNGDGCEDKCDCCPDVECPQGQVAIDANADGCPDTCVCDQAVVGQCGGFDYSNDPFCDPNGLDCGLAGILGDLNCDGIYEVCLECTSGTVPVDTNGDGCEDMCNCCDELTCPVGQIPVDLDGDLCPDVCECANTVNGQCDGFDYSNDPFCDPNGLDCGLAGILGDLNCDGVYEVCLECPPGTVPVDTNNDGCEDKCDCCEDVACPPGHLALDTDADGCADICLCEQAESGQCIGFDYSNDSSCDPFGPDCGGANAINADLDCDGAYEVCLLCAPGTIPVDSNGDGCEDLCNCCEEVVCDEGEVPIDTDGDLCPDLCECAAGKSGQCDGFDYSNDPFCDPNGLDCGLAGILGDLNCDGIYEVCLECEPGTVPVDTNGDGCEDKCDCDKLGPDLCEIGLTGMCPGEDYSNDLCDTGQFCGGIGVQGDADCDGQYDSCISCPDGTVPVDTTGDSCFDSCDCCVPLECPADLVPIDWDQDGCDDQCVTPLPNICKSGLTGMCLGYDYKDQCDPSFCSPVGVQGDGDCDGLYDICLPCPENTFPVDTNGDDCPDSCDCCPGISCPVGTTPTDTDDDGCEDKCVPDGPECCMPLVDGECPEFGDLTVDGGANVIDVVCLILNVLYTLADDPNAPLPECLAGNDLAAADLNCDALVNVTDVLLSIKVALQTPIGSGLDDNNDGCPDLCQ